MPSCLLRPLIFVFQYSKNGSFHDSIEFEMFYVTFSSDTECSSQPDTQVGTKRQPTPDVKSVWAVDMHLAYAKMAMYVAVSELLRFLTF